MLRPHLGGDLGSASVIVIDDTVSIDWLVNKTIHFFKHESCGKCTPCREGTYWMSTSPNASTHGHGKTEDVDLLLNVAKQMQGKCLCALGEFATMAVVTGIERFPQDFEKSCSGAPSNVRRTGSAALHIRKRYVKTGNAHD
jgi:NADH-quinone oxidoreductase subunit F